MAKDPAFLFYPNDYIGGTMGMTFEEKGAYIELLMTQFNRGHMTEHMIGQIVGHLWVKLKDKFVVDDNGLYYNIRLEQEQNKRKEYTKSRRNNVLGINQYTKTLSKKDGHITKHMNGHMENENINENIDNKKEIDFLKFWDLYDKKVGNKEKCKKKWMALSQVDTKIIFDTLPKFLSNIKDKQFQPYPETYLNNKRWLDEISEPPKNQNIAHHPQPAN